MKRFLNWFLILNLLMPMPVQFAQAPPPAESFQSTPKKEIAASQKTNTSTGASKSVVASDDSLSTPNPLSAPNPQISGDASAKKASAQTVSAMNALPLPMSSGSPDPGSGFPPNQPTTCTRSGAGTNGSARICTTVFNGIKTIRTETNTRNTDADSFGGYKQINTTNIQIRKWEWDLTVTNWRDLSESENFTSETSYHNFSLGITQKLNGTETLTVRSSGHYDIVRGFVFDSYFNQLDKVITTKKLYTITRPDRTVVHKFLISKEENYVQTNETPPPQAPVYEYAGEIIMYDYHTSGPARSRFKSRQTQSWDVDGVTVLRKLERDLSNPGDGILETCTGNYPTACR